MKKLSLFKSAKELVIGEDSLSVLSTYIEKLKLKNPLIVTDKGIKKSETLNAIYPYLEESQLSYGIFDDVLPEPEINTVHICSDYFEKNGHDSVIAVGGGSVMDIAKCAAIFSGYQGDISDLFGVDKVPARCIPIIAIPTTSGTGSEVTNIAILSDTESQVKKGIVSDYLLPDVAIVSPQMTLKCPASITAASGIDALVHAVEAVLSVNASPLTDALAYKAIELISASLVKAYRTPDDIQAREGMANGSLMAGLAFGNAGVGAVHALAYPLGGKYNMAHGVSNALLLPHVMEFNKLVSYEKFSLIGKSMGLAMSETDHKKNADVVIAEMKRLCKEVDIPEGLRSFGIELEDIPWLASEAIKIERLLKNNPKQLTEKEIETIYRNSY